MSNGANAVLVVRDSLPEHIKDLEAELEKAIARVHEINKQIALARTLTQIVPPEAL